MATPASVDATFTCPIFIEDYDEFEHLLDPAAAAAAASAKPGLPRDAATAVDERAAALAAADRVATVTHVIKRRYVRTVDGRGRVTVDEVEIPVPTAPIKTAWRWPHALTLATMAPPTTLDDLCTAVRRMAPLLPTLPGGDSGADVPGTTPERDGGDAGAVADARTVANEIDRVCRTVLADDGSRFDDLLARAGQINAAVADMDAALPRGHLVTVPWPRLVSGGGDSGDTGLVLDVRSWRAANPLATQVNLHPDVTDADLVGLDVTAALDTAGRLTRAPLLRVDASRCVKVSDAGLAAVAGVRELCVAGLAQLTDAALAPFTNLVSLNMAGCHGITDAGVSSHLTRLQWLNMDGCINVTGQSLSKLTALRGLSMCACMQYTLADTVLEGMTQLQTLLMAGSRGSLSAAAFAFRPTLRHVDMSGCTQLSPAALHHMACVEVLDVSGCTGLNDDAFTHLPALRSLRMVGCNQPTITDAAFAHLTGLTRLDMSGCDQGTITTAGLAGLTNLTTLALDSCTQTTISPTLFQSLPHLTRLRGVACPAVAAAVEAGTLPPHVEVVM